jgi:hypothetical protein
METSRAGRNAPDAALATASLTVIAGMPPVD